MAEQQPQQKLKGGMGMPTSRGGPVKKAIVMKAVKAVWTSPAPPSGPDNSKRNGMGGAPRPQPPSLSPLFSFH